MTRTLQDLADHWCNRLVTSLDLTLSDEHTFTLTETGAAVGSLRVYTGTARVVDSRLVVPDEAIDSVMLHAFAPATSPAPHFMSDVACLRGGWHMHADLVPRVDLGAEPVYLDTVYPPLESAISAIDAVPGAEPIHSPRRLQALSSPWHVAVRVMPADAEAVDTAHLHFQDRFLDHLDGGATGALATADQLAVRDGLHRASMFTPTTDPVWDYLASLIGQDSVDAIIRAVSVPA